MADPNPIFDTRKFTLTLIVSFVVVFIFSMIMMLWHGSFENKNGKINYNTHVVEPSSSY